MQGENRFIKLLLFSTAGGEVLLYGFSSPTNQPFLTWKQREISKKHQSVLTAILSLVRTAFPVCFEVKTIVYPTLVCAMDVFPIQRWKTVQQAGFGHFGATNSAKKIVTDRLFFKSNYFLYTYETYLGLRCEGAMGAVIPTIVIAPGSRSFALFGARTEHGVVLVVRQ